MTRISARLTTFLAATALLAGVVAASCSTTKTSPDVGQVSFALTAGGLTITQVNYTINQGTTPVTTGVISVSDPNATVSLDLVLPVGTGYTLSLTATAQPGNVACTSGASAPFSIVANQTTSVPTLTLTCGTTGTASGQTGSATINATVSVVNGDNCPSIGFLSASPAATSVGTPVALTAKASDSDASDVLTYAWSVGGTTFANGTSAVFSCSPSGTQTITLTVDDHHTPSNCPASATISVNCIATGIGGSTGTGGSATGTGGAATGGAAGAGTGGAAGAGTGGTGTGGTGTGGTGTGGTGTGGTGTGGMMSEAACGACELASSDGNCDPGFLSQDGSGAPFGCDSLSTAGQVTACKALLTCINANNCVTNGNGTAAGDNAVEGCYCGPAPETSSACNGGTGVVGLCKSQFHDAAVADGAAGDPRAAGLTTASAEGAFASFISVASFDPTTAVGMADNIKDCAVHSACTPCNIL